MCPNRITGPKHDPRRLDHGAGAAASAAAAVALPALPPLQHLPQHLRLQGGGRGDQRGLVGLVCAPGAAEETAVDEEVRHEGVDTGGDVGVVRRQCGLWGVGLCGGEAGGGGG